MRQCLLCTELRPIFVPYLGMIETAQADEKAKGNGNGQSAGTRRGVQIVDDEPQQQSSGGCCS